MMRNDFGEVLKFYFSFKGLATRKQFWLYFYLPLVLFFALRYGLTQEYGVMVQMSWVVLLSINLIVLWVLLAVMVKRLRDIGWPVWIVVFNFIPILGNLVMTVICGFVPSKKIEDNHA